MFHIKNKKRAEPLSLKNGSTNVILMELYFYCKSSGSLPVEAYIEKTLLLLTLFKINTIK